MGFFDKLKNVFFEEEEVEVDEEEEREKIHVAKKIDTVEPKKQEEPESNKLEIEKYEDEEKDFKFPIGFDDKDFEVEKTIEIFAPVKETEPIVEEVQEVISDEPPVDLPVEEEYSYEEVKYEEPERELYRKEVVETHHRLYEGKERDEKQTFTPSPIISPIYGILNKNYKKEEIVDKNEKKNVDLSIKKDDLDLVREKAYGDLAGDISASIDDDIIDIEEEKPKEKEDLLYDLSDEKSPTVKTVTVGDAEEYFNDLGLEYNVDYKVEREVEKEEEKPKHTRAEKIDSNEDEDDKNLFDLIDAMYDEEEKE